MKQFQATFELDEAQLFRRLHIDDDSYAAASARDSVPGLKEFLAREGDLQAWYLEGGREIVTGILEVDACKARVICLVTLSQRVSDRIAALSTEGAYLEAYLLNDLADAVLFHASDELHRYLTESFCDRGEFLTRKIFPGENGIPLQRQKQFLDILKKGEDLPVEINSSYMLLPEKTLLYAFGADPENEPRSWEHDCSQCEKADCAFRASGKGGAVCQR